MPMPRRRVLILGAAGRDFHNFNVRYRGRDDVEVVGFTATQIPNIADRRYPASLAGPRYPDGIPIHDEADLEALIERLRVDEAIFSYSDVSYVHLGNVASRVQAAGADFTLLSAASTMLPATVPVVSICAVRTGCGKSQTTRRVCALLQELGKRVVAVRHPMPYGDLARQAVQRFASLEDLDAADCTIEEREEYEPHLVRGIVVYAGVDYGAILERAQQEADVLVWDGGNNDTPFLRSDLEIVLVDPHRPGHETAYYPGEVNLRRAHVVVINKMDTAEPAGIEQVRASVRRLNPGARVIEADSPCTVEQPERIRGRRVLAVEDGPTLTHGEMKYGAAVVAAREHGAARLVDPRPFAVGSIAETFARYPGIGTLLPAMGYGQVQIADLQETIRRTDCDLVLIGTPIDLRRVIRIDRPALRVGYELRERGGSGLRAALERVV
jgi:predicted GTPase